eukprot:2187796-Pyramimonas_sp.AAC.1
MEAHRAGPMPPRVAAIRGRTYDTIRRNAELVQGPAFALLGELSEEEFTQSVPLLRAEYNSDDWPDSLPQPTYATLSPLVMPTDAPSLADAAEMGKRTH